MTVKGMEMCDIPFCSRSDYTGNISETVSGRKCQKWSSLNPYKLVIIGITENDFPDKDIKSANNYCRNPNSLQQGPWCFTTDPDKVLESCLIPGFKVGFRQI